jgi:hypothetical protein
LASPSNLASIDKEHRWFGKTRSEVPTSDSDKIVAATLAAAKVTAASATSAEDFTAEYQEFLFHFEMRGEIAIQQMSQPFSLVPAGPLGAG